VLNFGLGIYAFHKRWFFNGNVPGHFLFWLGSSFALWFCWDAAFASIIQSFSMHTAILLVFTRPFLHFSILLTLMAFGIQHWQSSSKINRMFSDNAYTIYLVHLVFVWIMLMALLGLWDLSIYLKFIVVAISSVLLSYLASHNVILKFAKQL